MNDKTNLDKEDKLNLIAYAIAKNMVDNKDRLLKDIEIATEILNEHDTKHA